MLQLSKNLVDYGAEMEEQETGGDFGLNMELEDDEEQESEDESEVEKIDEEGELSDDFENKNLNQDDDNEDKALRQIGNLDKENETDSKNTSLNIGKIDGFWLQTEINKYFDLNSVLKLEKEILKILQVGDKRECENKLVLLLSQEKFPFIKVLLENRWAIYYCVRLGQSQSQDETEEIMTEMERTQEGREIQAKIQSSKLRLDKEKEFSKNVRKEALILSKRTILTTSNLIDGDMRITASDMKKQDRNILNLETLQFENSHVMTNTSCKLPKGSVRETKKGYEEVYIPPMINKIDDNEKIVRTEEIPGWMHTAFQSRDKNDKLVTMEKFNRVQSKVLNSALYSDENMLICAPTSSGKTIVALLTILRLVSQHRNKNGSINLDKFKAVFIAPMKALVKETVGNLTGRLAGFGMVVRELSGDINLTKKELDETHIIVSTPEKWDIITRKTGERTFTDFIKLVIIDEIHLLHDSRGPVIESIVARTIRRIETTKEQVRIVALSATLPNYEDVATFLRIDFKKGLFYFDNSYRPVPLKQHYIGITEKKSVKKMLLMNEITYDKVIERAGKHQMIIFVHSRRETVRTARAIREMAMAKDDIGKLMKEEGSYKEILQSEIGNIKDNDLKDLLPYCMGVHHAGMNREDRALVEDLFNEGHLQIIVSTSTLAWGVNLPAHTVIIKGTTIYNPELGDWVELSSQDIMQMMGRAGRLGYDSSGEGIVITSHSELQYYLSLLNQQVYYIK